MKYVLNADGSITIGPKGHPMVDPEVTGQAPYEVDAMGAQDRITALNTESKGYRTRAQAAEKALLPFKDMDATAATEAIATVATLGDDHKADMTKLKADLETSYKTATDAKDTEIKDLNGKLYSLNVTNKFSTSEVVKKTILPPDIAATYFGKHFQEDGSAKDSSGNVIYSKEKPGEPAGFDEALGVIIEQYPQKANILLSANNSGGGGHQGGGGGGGGELSSRDSIKAGLVARA